MAQYDGSIRINTEINTKNATSQMMSLENQIVKTADKINSLRTKMDALKGTEVPTQEYAKLQNDIGKATAKLEQLKAQQASLKSSGNMFSADWKALSERSQEASLNIRNIKQEMESLKSTGVATKTVPTEEYAELERKLSSSKDFLARFINEQNKLTESGKQYTEEWNNLSKYIEGQSSLIKEIEQRMQSLRDSGKAEKTVPTEEYAQLQSQLQKWQENVKAIEAEQEKLRQSGKQFTNEWNDSANKIREARAQINTISADIKSLENEGKAFTIGSNTEEFEKLSQQLKYAENDLSALNKRHEELTEKQKKSSDGYRQLGSAAKKSLDSVEKILKKLNSAVSKFGSLVKKAFSNLTKSADKAKKSSRGLEAMFKNILKYGLGIRSIYALVNKLRTAVKEGFSNMANEVEGFKVKVDSLKASTLTLKNSFAAAFRPLVEIAIPYIQKLIDAMYELFNTIGQFMAAITGQETYTKAIKQTTAAIEDENKAQNKQLSGLDKLNNLSSNSGNEDNATGNMFEEIPLESKWSELADRVKKIAEDFFKPFKTAWDADGKFVMDSWKYALDEIKKLAKDIGLDFMETWQQDKTVAIFDNILRIIGDIGFAFGNLARNFRDAWSENNVGLHIFENIRDIIGTIVQHIRNAADATVEWSANLDFYPLLDAFNRFLDSLKPVVDSLMGVLEDFYTKVLLPLGEWVLEEGLPELLQVFIDFNNEVDWEALKDNLSEFWEHLRPFAKRVGEGLILFVERISELVSDFLNSEKFTGFLDKLQEWMDNTTPEDVADGIVSLAKAFIELKLALLGLSTLKTVLPILNSVLGISEKLSNFGGFGISAGATAMFFDVFKQEKTVKEEAEYESKLKEIKKAHEEGKTSAEEYSESIKSILDEWGVAQSESFRFPGVEYDENGWNTTLVKIKDKISDWWNDVTESISSGWETIKNRIFAINVFLDEEILKFLENCKQNFQDFDTFLQLVFETDWSESFGAFGEILNVFLDDVEGIWNFAKYIFSGFIDFLIGVFTGDWEKAWNGLVSFTSGIWNGMKATITTVTGAIKTGIAVALSTIQYIWNKTWTGLKTTTVNIFNRIWLAIKGVINSILSGIESMANGVINGINFVIGALNGLSFEIPEFDVFGKKLGGETIGFNIPEIPNVSIPRLATGAVIPANKEFLAVLGDQKHGTNIEAPLDTIVDAVKIALSSLEFSGNSDGGKVRLEIPVYLDKREIGRGVQEYDREIFLTRGKGAFEH